MSYGDSQPGGMFLEPRRMDFLSCSLLVRRALSAQLRSVGAVAPERVVASFLCSRLVSCTCALLWMFILTHATSLKPFHSKQSYPLHHLQHVANTTLRVFNVAMPVRGHFTWTRVSSPTETLHNTSIYRHWQPHCAQLQDRYS